MTEIHIDYGILEIKGHACFAEKGQDVVCAGISTLLYTFAKALDDRRLMTKFELDDGYAIVKWDITKTSNILMDTFKGGFEMVAGTYPEHAKII